MPSHAKDSRPGSPLKPSRVASDAQSSVDLAQPLSISPLKRSRVPSDAEVSRIKRLRDVHIFPPMKASASSIVAPKKEKGGFASSEDYDVEMFGNFGVGHDGLVDGCKLIVTPPTRTEEGKAAFRNSHAQRTHTGGVTPLSILE
ncbi:hypothetical protein GQ43DRAFT_152736 [Delitschia confertaspora ATCC 74209]|uniref:Uncharacterized protein n=1 Tax=Delitschia confertaspora ATCC 74209 TaxID=1513339 RepID=A0A9P4N278_9PLEO|nr:hypothetical protein GQ43DRAFT_152736 [Delitschia confertaspora ATCC 74209]